MTHLGSPWTPARRAGHAQAGRGLLLAFVATGLLQARTAAPAFNLVVSDETAPSGGWVQFKVSLAQPRQIRDGQLSMDFDPGVFGNISNVAVFSGAGDAAGYANVAGNHLDAHFYSTSGGIGQLPGLPVMVVSMPVLAGLAKGTSTGVTVDMADSGFNDTAGNQYQAAVVPAVFRVGGALSIQSVTPGGGELPTGAMLQIRGAGFDASTSATLDGASVAAVQWIGPGQMLVTLGAGAEMTGKHLRLNNAAGEQVDYYASLPSAPSDAPSTVWPLVPLNTYELVNWYLNLGSPLSEVSWALLNPNPAPVTVTFFDYSMPGNILSKTIVLNIPAGEMYFPGMDSIAAGPFDNLTMAASAPIRALAWRADFQTNPIGYVSYTFPPGPVLAAAYTSPPMSWNWQVGAPAPAAQTTTVKVYGSSGFTVSVSPEAQKWLAVTPLQGSASATLTLTPKVSSLSPGTYAGTVAVTALAPGFLLTWSTIPVVLNVSAFPFITANWSNGSSLATFVFQVGGQNPRPQPIKVSGAGNAPVQATASTSSGGNWLSVAGSASAGFAVTADPSGLPAGSYAGQISIQGPANTVALPLTLEVEAAGPTSPSSLQFQQQFGSSEPVATWFLNVESGSGYAVSAQTQSGGNWLNAAFMPGTGGYTVTVTVNSSGLGPGTYQGAVTLTSPSSPTLQVPVSLAVIAPPDAVSVTPGSLFLAAAPGQTSAAVPLTVTSTNGTALVQFRVSLFASATGLGAGSPSWVKVTGPATPSGETALDTPATLQVQAGASLPGTYYGSAEVVWSGGTVTVPMVLSVPPDPSLPPIIAGVVNAASEAARAISPGEIITLFGIGLGASPSEFTLNASGKVPTTVGGTQVLINGQAAPILYASSGQVNAIVPYEVETSGTAAIQVVWNGIGSAAWGVPLAPSAPGIFAVGSLGIGQAAALNQDNSVNGSSNPAARGSVVQIFATGEGQTSPANVTGGVTGSGNSTTQPVTVSIGGIGATVAYNGSAPDEVSGVLQVNAVVPAGVTPGTAVPVVIQVGSQKSQSGITIAVQ
jgi:uncharacterized protein (TIGR03437 family)